MYDNYEIPEEEWIVSMPLQAWRTAMEFEENCKRSGLDSYDQAQINLLAVSGPKENALWAHVWNYIQARNAAGKDDRFLVVIDMPS